MSDQGSRLRNAYEALQAEVAALRAQLAQAREALGGLVDRLDYVHASAKYMGVWLIAQNHVGPYDGPTYIEQLDVARELLHRLALDGQSRALRSAPQPPAAALPKEEGK